MDESSSSSSSDDDGKEERLSSSDESVSEGVKEDKYHLTLEDLEKIRISRDNIERWYEYNFFRKTVIGI